MPVTMKQRIEEKIDQHVEKILAKEELDEKDFATLQVCYTLYALREVNTIPPIGIGCC